MELTTEQFYKKHGFIVVIGNSKVELEEEVQLKPNRYLGIYSACITNGFRPQIGNCLGILNIKAIYFDCYDLSHYITTTEKNKEKKVLVVTLNLE